MADWTDSYGRSDPTIINTATEFGLALETLGGGASASATWPTGNSAFYYPFKVRRPFNAVYMYVMNGAAVSGNVDLGIYDLAGNRLVSTGSTAHAGTSAIQTFNITDTLLYPGVYYMAMNCSNTTSQFQRWSGNVLATRLLGVLTQAVGAVTLPNPATFTSTAISFFPIVGISSKTVI